MTLPNSIQSGEASVPVYISASAPAPPILSGSLWFETITSKMYIWMVQPGDDEWVEIFNTPGDIPFVYVSASAPSDPINGTLWYNPGSGDLSIWVEDGISDHWEALINNSPPSPLPASVIVSVSPPLSPTPGLLWYKPTNHTLYVWVTGGAGSSWEAVSGTSPSNKPTVYVSTTAPGNPSQGDLWWHPLLKELRVWNLSPTGNQWILVTDNTPPPQTPPVYNSVTTPVNPKRGFLWYNPQKLETKFWDGYTWILMSKIIPDLMNLDTQGKVNNSLLYYDSAAGKFKANSSVTTSSLTDGGNF